MIAALYVETAGGYFGLPRVDPWDEVHRHSERVPRSAVVDGINFCLPKRRQVSAMKWALIENMVTIASTSALVLGLYAMGAGGWAGFGFLLLININTSYQVKSVGDKDSLKTAKGEQQ